jgi:hypothetical protein
VLRRLLAFRSIWMLEMFAGTSALLLHLVRACNRRIPDRFEGIC